MSAALFISLGFCLRRHLSKEKAAGGGAGKKGGSAGTDNASGEPIHTSKPFLAIFANKKKTIQEAYKAASRDAKHQGKAIPNRMKDPADIFDGNVDNAQSAINKFFG